MIDRRWNPHVAGWHDKGRDDPDIALMRHDLEGAEIWGNASPVLAWIKSLLGRKPQEGFSDKVAEVPLR